MVDVKNYVKKEVIRPCPYCHHDITMKKGLSSENIKRLFRKPTIEDLITLFIVFLTITSFLVYNYEIKTYKGYINDNCPVGQQNQQSSEIYLPGSLNELNSTFYGNGSTLILNNTNQADETEG